MPPLFSRRLWTHRLCARGRIRSVHTENWVQRCMTRLPESEVKPKLEELVQKLEIKVGEVATNGYLYPGIVEAVNDLNSQYGDRLVERGVIGAANKAKDAQKKLWDELFPGRYETIQERKSIKRDSSGFPLELQLRFYRELGRREAIPQHLVKTFLQLDPPRSLKIDPHSFEKFMKIVFSAKRYNLKALAFPLQEIARDLEGCGMRLTDKEKMVLVRARYAFAKFGRKSVSKVLKELPLRPGVLVLLNHLALRTRRNLLLASTDQICQKAIEQNLTPNSALIGMLLKSSVLSKNRSTMVNVMDLLVCQRILPLNGKLLGNLIETLSSFGEVDLALRLAKLMKPAQFFPLAESKRYALQEQFDLLYTKLELENNVLVPLEATETTFDNFFPLQKGSTMDESRSYIQASGIIEFMKYNEFVPSSKTFERIFRSFSRVQHHKESWNYTQLREVVAMLIEQKQKVRTVFRELKPQNETLNLHLTEMLVSSLVDAYMKTTGSHNSEKCTEILRAFRDVNKGAPQYTRARDEFLLQEISKLFQLSYLSV
ncbi:unnamed protein product [Kuraishia capsulata CBS 1993]|uniref:Uncharacterized protein n=1 Tax=Kuraishia capsulata CBS 1993 TaxID=1382522 RepID=W6MRP8_9ASCO|nr:uncharacterized protein KUCA_T00005434001 [Kuraishia capsulata CBS 1993]CDK29446.1 unnamed protein product [Kuraishia capsulata CBS 1993]